MRNNRNRCYYCVKFNLEKKYDFVKMWNMQTTQSSFYNEMQNHANNLVSIFRIY